MQDERERILQAALLQSVHEFDAEWSAIGAVRQQAATRLGWTEASWNARDRSPFAQCWSGFSDAQVAAAYALDYEARDFAEGEAPPPARAEPQPTPAPARPPPSVVPHEDALTVASSVNSEDLAAAIAMSLAEPEVSAAEVTDGGLGLPPRDSPPRPACLEEPEPEVQPHIQVMDASKRVVVDVGHSTYVGTGKDNYFITILIGGSTIHSFTGAVQ